MRPTIYAQLDSGGIRSFPLFNFIGDGRIKAHLLFSEGRLVGQKHQEHELRETCLITEVWLTREQRNPNPGSRPPAGIPQKEAVMFAIAINSEPYQTLVKLYEIKRKKGKATELVYWNESVDPEGLMGLAFIADWRSRTMSDAEVRQLQPRGHAGLFAVARNPACPGFSSIPSLRETQCTLSCCVQPARWMAYMYRIPLKIVATMG